MLFIFTHSENVCLPIPRMGEVVTGVWLKLKRVELQVSSHSAISTELQFNGTGIAGRLVDRKRVAQKKQPGATRSLGSWASNRRGSCARRARKGRDFAGTRNRKAVGMGRRHQVLMDRAPRLSPGKAAGEPAEGERTLPFFPAKPSEAKVTSSGGPSERRESENTDRWAQARLRTPGHLHWAGTVPRKLQPSSSREASGKF